MHRSLILPLLPLTLLLVGAAPDGSTIAHDGNGNGAMACVSCHGQRFQGNLAIGAPALAGLPDVKILERLTHYAGPNGHNPLMRQVATALSTPERQAVASYLSSLPAPH
jgi:thiosulfate dehydrogenase